MKIKTTALLFALSMSVAPIASGSQVDKTQLFKLNSSDPAVRRAAVYYLSQTGDRSLVPRICEVLLKDNNPDVRSTAAQGLGDLGGKEAEKCLLKALKREKNQGVEESIVASLVTFNDKKLSRLMCKLAFSKDPNIRDSALTALIQYGENPCDARLLKELKSTKDYGEKVKIAQVLGFHHYKPAKNYMLKLLKSGNTNDKIVALTYFKYYPLGDTVPYLEKILTKSPDEKLNSLAFDVLIATDDQRAYNLIQKLLINPEFKKEFSFRLATLKINLPDSIIRYLINDSKSSNNTVMKVALLSYIGNHHLSKYCNFIKEKLYSPSDDVRAAAIWALGRTNCSDSVRMLCEIIMNLSIDDSIRKDAAAALTHLKPEILRKNLDLLEEAYRNEIFDDIKDLIEKAIKKATAKRGA